MGATDWILLLVLGTLWGGSYFFGKVALAQLPPFTVAVGRLGLAALVLQVVVRAAGHEMPGSIRAWRAFAVMGLLNNAIPMSLILWGQTTIGSGLAAILNASTPLFTVLLAHFFTRDERMTGRKVGGMLFGLAGVAVMIGPDAVGGLHRGLLAQLAMVGAAISYACAGIFGRRFAGTPPLVTAAGQVTASSLTLLPTVIVRRPSMALARPRIQDMGGARRARLPVHGPRLRHLFPHPRHVGREQSPPRHVAHARQRRAPRHRLPR